MPLPPMWQYMYSPNAMGTPYIPRGGIGGSLYSNLRQQNARYFQMLPQFFMQQMQHRAAGQGGYMPQSMLGMMGNRGGGGGRGRPMAGRAAPAGYGGMPQAKLAGLGAQRGGVGAPAMNAPSAMYGSPTGGVQGPLGALLGQYQTAFDDANAANEQRYGQLLSGYDQRYARGMELANAARDQQYRHELARVNQDLTARGLRASTLPGTAAHNAFERAQQIPLAQHNATSADKLGVIERRTDNAPDIGMMTQLAMAAGQAQSQREGLGGQLQMLQMLMNQQNQGLNQQQYPRAPLNPYVVGSSPDDPGGVRYRPAFGPGGYFGGGPGGGQQQQQPQQQLDNNMVLQAIVAMMNQRGRGGQQQGGQQYAQPIGPPRPRNQPRWKPSMGGQNYYRGRADAERRRQEQAAAAAYFQQWLNQGGFQPNPWDYQWPQQQGSNLSQAYQQYQANRGY